MQRSGGKYVLGQDIASAWVCSKSRMIQFEAQNESQHGQSLMEERDSGRDQIREVGSRVPQILVGDIEYFTFRCDRMPLVISNKGNDMV